MSKKSLPLLILLFFSGCAGLKTAPDPDVPAAAAIGREARPPPSGLSVEGRLLTCSVLGHGGDTLLVLGGIHGDEPAGATLAGAFRDYLLIHGEALQGKRVVIAPALNPDGLAAGRRFNSRGVDLNRNFASRNRKNSQRNGSEALSQPEARFIVTLIERYQPDRIVTIHQPLACVDFDGPAADLARAVADRCGLPLKKIGALQGSLGSYAGCDLMIPLITLELPGAASRLDSEALWEAFGGALVAALEFPKKSGSAIAP